MPSVTGKSLQMQKVESPLVNSSLSLIVQTIIFLTYLPVSRIVVMSSLLTQAVRLMSQKMALRNSTMG